MNLNRVHNPTPGVAAAATVEPLERRTLFAAMKIMPLGDSITEALDGDATYRYWLWHQLKAAGRDVDFVGSARGVWNGTPRFADFDQDHEGHVGFRVDTLVGRVQEWATAHRPDVVLLHIGTNDLLQGQSVESTVSELGQVIDRLRVANPNVVILLAQVIPSPYIPAIATYNQQIPGLAAAKNTSASPITVVDQFTGFDGMTDTDDGLHPDESGEKKMADKWMAALMNVVPPPDPNPYLGDMRFRVVRNGLGPVERNKSNGGVEAGDGRTIKLNGVLFRKGLGVHAHSDLRFDLEGKYRQFTTLAGVDDEVGNHSGSVIFRVYVDGVKAYDSGPVYGRTGTKAISLDVTGARTLRLLVTDKGDGNAKDSASWADARLFSIVPVGGPSLQSVKPGTFADGRGGDPSWWDEVDGERGRDPGVR